jgi:hypothetical protein
LETAVDVTGVSGTGEEEVTLSSAFVERTAGDVTRVFKPVPGAPAGNRRLAAAAARDAGREAALKTTEEELSALFDKHRELARKRVLGEISVSEDLELQLIRWELDRIEDARSGPARDVLWAALDPRRELAQEITKLVEQLKAAGVEGRQRGRKR